MNDEVDKSSQSDLRDRTFQYARRIFRLYRALPQNDEGRIVGRQLLRSGTSVGANYREAFRARSRPEFVSICGICVRELDETDFWLCLIREEGLVEPLRLAEIEDETNQLIAIFTKIIKSTRSS